MPLATAVPVAMTNLRLNITKMHCQDQVIEVTSHLAQVKTMLSENSMLPPSFTEQLMREHLEFVRSMERDISRHLFGISTTIG